MSLYDTTLNALLQESGLSDEKARELAGEITRLIEHQAGLTSLPDTFVQHKIEEQAQTIQVMLAQDHSSIQNAAQYVIQVLTEDPRATIPETFRTEQHCPYPGLSAFTETDADYFYGRDNDSESFLRHINRPIIALTGPAGVGKSSFISAGVLPRLKNRFGDRAVYLTFRIHTNTDLLQDLAEYLSASTGETTESVLQALRHRDDALLTSLQIALGSKYERVFLFLDQFEALFVGEEENRVHDRHNLLDNLMFTREHQEPRFLTTIVVTRQNFIEHPAYTRHAGLFEIIQRENVPLFALSDQQLRQAIEQPLNTFNQLHSINLSYQRGLVDLLVGEFHNPAVSLPLIQYLLRLLWIEKRHLTHFAYNSLGGLERVLDRHAWEIYRGFADEDQQLVKAILIALVRPGISGEYTRKRIRRETLLQNKRSAQRQRVERALSRLSDARSRIISERQIGNTAYLELTHEIILRQWAFLQGLIEERKERIEAREALLPKAEVWRKSWELKGGLGETGELYTGNELKRAQHYIDSALYPEDIDGSIAVCYEASQQHRKRRLARLALVAIVISLLFVIIVFFLLSQTTSERQRANENATAQAIAEAEQVTAEANAATAVVLQGLANTQALKEQQISRSGELASQALNMLDDSLDLALLLSVEAHNSADTFEAQNSLLTTFQYSPKAHLLLREHTSEIHSLGFSRDDATLTSVSMDKSILRWNLETGSPDYMHQSQEFVDDATVSPSGQTVAMNKRGTIVLFNVQTKKTIAQFTLVNRPSVSSLAFNQNETVLAIGIQGGLIELWDVSSDPLFVRELKSGEDDVTSIAFSRDGKLLVSGSQDGTVVIWDLETSRPIREIDGFQLRRNGEVATNDSADLIAFTARDDSIQLLDQSNYEPVGNTLYGHTASITSAAFSPNGRMLATGSIDSTVIIWDVASGQPLGEPLRGHTDTVLKVAFSHDGRMLASGSWDGTIIVWDVDRWSPYQRKVEAFMQSASEVAYNPNTQTFASISYETVDLDYVDVNILLWDVTSRQPKGLLRTNFTYPFGSLVFSSDGQLIAFSTKGALTVWDVTNGQTLFTDFTEHPVGDKLAFSTDDVLLASGGGLIYSDGTGQATVRIWDLNNGIARDELITAFSNISSLEFSPTEQLLAVSGQGKDTFGNERAIIQLWDYSTGRKVGKSLLAHSDSISEMQFSPNGKYLAATNGDNTMTLWNVSSAQPLYQPLKMEPTNTLAFSSDGRMIATGGHIAGASTTFVQLWDMESGRPLGDTFFVDTNQFFGLSFTSDGRYLEFATWPDIYLQLDVDVDAWRTHACRTANRNFSLGEWEQFFPGQEYRLTCPSLPIHPSFVEAAQQLAREGNINGAIIQFQELLHLYPTVGVDPEQEAKYFAAQGLVEEGDELAIALSVEAAITNYEQALELNPELDFVPATKANKLAAPTLVQQGRNLARDGQIKQAIILFEEAQALDPDVEITGDGWNTICWYGAVWEYALEVMDYCNRAVESRIGWGAYHDSRGIARALTGNYEGAIADFRVYLEWQTDYHAGAQRQLRENWIETLKASRNPFNQTTLLSLR